MDPELFESLLYQAESEVLDFKLAQYPFEAATDIQKSELLKDILSFANSWRQSDAHILIGVEEVRGARSLVRGVSGQLLNRNLQQFVHSKTNRAVSFRYEGLQVEGVQVAAITIPLQERPIYLRNDFGKLKANVVYVRRGDSTGEAPPDEIVKMGQAKLVADAQPSLNLEFADLELRRLIGAELNAQTIKFKMPEAKSIPDYGTMRNGGFVLPAAVSGNNPDYLREIAAYVFDYGRFVPIGFAVENSATAPAVNVVVRIRVPSDVAEIRAKDDMPDEPSTTWATRFRPQTPFREKSPVSVSRHGDFYAVRIEIGTIQPGITEFSPEPIFVEASKPLDFSLEAVLSGDNLRIPTAQKLRLKVQVESREVSLTELKKFAL